MHLDLNDSTASTVELNNDFKSAVDPDFIGGMYNSVETVRIYDSLVVVIIISDFCPRDIKILICN